MAILSLFSPNGGALRRPRDCFKNCSGGRMGVIIEHRSGAYLKYVGTGARLDDGQSGFWNSL